jgi:Rrf2 family iron-sulfur cluster assembly transcriptional regulator
LRASVALARLQSEGTPVSIQALAKEENISSVFLEQIFFKLRKAGIVSSVRGPGGGFCLCKSPKKLTVKEILIAAGEELDMTACDRRFENCDRRKNCPSHSVWEDITNIVKTYLENLTLAQVMEREIVSEK